MMSRLLSLALALAAALQTGQSAAPELEDEYAIVTVSSDPQKCNLALATKVELRTFATEPHEWTGKCLAVDGYWVGRALFASRLDARQRYAQSNDAVSRRRVGIYGTTELLSSAPRVPAAYTAIGIAGQCKTLGEGAIMVMGYCHYTGGAYIAVAEMHRR